MKLSQEVLRFLERLVDRLDAAEQRGASKAQSVPLNSRVWPELVSASYESDKEVLWEGARRLHAKGWIRLIPEAAAHSVAGYAQDVRVSVLNGTEVRAAVGRPERLKSVVERWRDAVNEHLDGPDEAKQGAGAYCIELARHTMPEVVRQLNELHRLKDQPLLLREVSARLLWGMSKVLDGRQGLVAAVLGRPECPFPESPVQLLVQLPDSELKGVLFIENMMSFEQAARSKSAQRENLALVFASGFKGSAQRLRSNGGASVYYSPRGPVSPERREVFESWLFAKSEELPAFFWGDLDWSGMAILRALRNSIDGLRAWQPGYEPMLACLLSGRGHSGDTADKLGQMTVEITGCTFADGRLLPALRNLGEFVDQEMFTL